MIISQCYVIGPDDNVGHIVGIRSTNVRVTVNVRERRFTKSKSKNLQETLKSLDYSCLVAILELNLIRYSIDFDNNLNRTLTVLFYL